MKTFFRYFFGVLFMPRRVFGRLAADPRRRRLGIQAVLLTAGLYALAAASLAVSGAVPMAPTFLPFRPENYYFWQMLFAPPLIIFVWILGSVLIHVPGRKQGPSLRTTLALFGFSLAGPMVLTWIPAAVIAAFFGLGMGQPEMVDILSTPSPAQTVFLAVFGLAAVWSFALVVLTAAVSRNVRWWKAILLGLPAEAVLITAVVLFLR
jgi:hypothetical protein